ncbi:ImmA/IrrE family metallo-endopeptidase [Cetobacterium sp.]|uniref:ImmA/IrrE family metallo-endopeptidase n=1 Tax=Cetobacterium sp. TaxID=2071632 RepID=UPI003F312CA1
MINIAKTKTTPLSRKWIRNLTEKIRDIWNFEDNDIIDITKFLEILSIDSILDDEFNYEILEDKDLPNVYAETNTDTGTIRIRESVYVGALNGISRDRFTIAHELGHFFLHKKNVSLCRSEDDVKIYEDPEWQANVFAAEFLAPSNKINDLTINQITQKFNVSKEVAKIQKSISQKNKKELS